MAAACTMSRTCSPSSPSEPALAPSIKHIDDRDRVGHSVKGRGHIRHVVAVELAQSDGLSGARERGAAVVGGAHVATQIGATWA